MRAIVDGAARAGAVGRVLGDHVRRAARRTGDDHLRQRVDTPVERGVLLVGPGAATGRAIDLDDADAVDVELAQHLVGHRARAGDDRLAGRMQEGWRDRLVVHHQQAAIVRRCAVLAVGAEAVVLDAHRDDHPHAGHRSRPHRCRCSHRPAHPPRSDRRADTARLRCIPPERPGQSATDLDTAEKLSAVGRAGAGGGGAGVGAGAGAGAGAGTSVETMSSLPPQPASRPDAPMNDSDAAPKPPRSNLRRAGSCRRCSISSLMWGLDEVLVTTSSSCSMGNASGCGSSGLRKGASVAMSNDRRVSS